MTQETGRGCFPCSGNNGHIGTDHYREVVLFQRLKCIPTTLESVLYTEVHCIILCHSNKVIVIQSKLSDRELKLKNITANIRRREEARKEPGNHVIIT